MKIIETQDPVGEATTVIAKALRAAIEVRGQAVMFVSGGSSPKPVFDALSETDLRWDKVMIGLVDERTDPRGSNAAMVRETLIQGAAVSATFLDMTEGGYADLVPADMCVLGMGSDGHTASWFPGSDDLSRAMDPDTTETVIRLRADGCPGAGEFPERLTLTLPAVMASRELLLFIPGAAKRAVFEARDGLPVDALTHSDRLRVICEPAT